MTNTFMPLGQNKAISWFLIDASEKNLGRLSTQVANLLQGKTQITYSPGADSRVYVIITNATKILLKRKKYDKKFYYSHSGKPGELKVRSFKEFYEKNPEKLLELSIKRMLPNGFAKSNLNKRLRVYKSDQHPHMSQKPKTINLLINNNS